MSGQHVPTFPPSRRELLDTINGTKVLLAAAMEQISAMLAADETNQELDKLGVMVSEAKATLEASAS